MAPSTRTRARVLALALPALLLAPAAAEAQSAKPCTGAGAATPGSPAAPATAAKAKRARAPRVSKVKPMRAAIGAVLELRGRDFVAGRCRNTVVFQRSGGKAVFVKADLATRKLLRVTLPDGLEKQLVVKRGLAVPTRFKLRVLSARFGKGFTAASRSPVIGPKPPPVSPAPPAPVPVPDVDTDGDGQLNSVDPDDDNDLLADEQERAINAQQGLSEDNGLKTLSRDTDGDSVEDGYELRSARDLNSTRFLPYPGKRPYANPLDGADGGTDFDGDGLSLAAEQRLWAYESARVGRPRSLEELSYSDGTKYSAYWIDGAGRRVPGLAAFGYEREAAFRAWATQTGLDRVDLRECDLDGRIVLGDLSKCADDVDGDGAADGKLVVVNRAIFDVNRNGVVDDGDRRRYPHSEARYYDNDGNGVLDDGERDEDADGLTNVDESEGETFLRRMARGFWLGRYQEGAFDRVEFLGTRFDDPDSDGDGIRDGADDQDFDDVPNVMELSRRMAVGDLDAKDAKIEDLPIRSWYGRVNPFNPCLPDTGSRTCPKYQPFEGGWAPFSDEPKHRPKYFVFE